MERQNYVGNSLTKLPPGLRFHPTDEEILFEYLRCKVFCLPLPASVIPEVDFLNFDPWNLPGNVEEKRYFFYKKQLIKNTRKQKKNQRVTGSGYWKANSSTKQINAPQTHHNNLGNFTHGLKKSFVFYQGKPPKGHRTHWYMHEYSLHFHNNCENLNVEDWVICTVFMKHRTEEVYDSSLLINEEQCSDNIYSYSMNNVGPSTYDNYCASPTSSSTSVYKVSPYEFNCSGEGNSYSP